MAGVEWSGGKELIMKNCKRLLYDNKTVISISIIFILVFIADKGLGNNLLFDTLSRSGFKKLNGEIYRLFTASFLHTNLLHLTANIVALLCVGSYLEKRLGSLKMLIIYICAELISSVLFYGYMNECTGGNGSSIVLYALFAILLVLWLRYPDEIPIKWYQPTCFYIIVFFFIANLISGSYMTIIIHACSFVSGLVIGLIIMKNCLKIE